MKKRLFNIVVNIAIALFFIFTYYYIYEKYNIGIPCIFHKLTNLYCPGCGITRCLFSILKGNFYEAFMYNQLVFILLPFIIIYYFINTFYYITDKKNNILKKIPNYFYILLLIIVILFGILRNFPEFPFLRP